MTSPPNRRSPLDRSALEDLMSRSGRLIGGSHEDETAQLMPDSSRLQRLLVLTQTMNRIHDRNELLVYIRDRLSELFDAENSKVVLVGRDGSLSVLGEADAAGRPKISSSLIRKVIQERAPRLIGDPAQDPEWKSKKSMMGLVSILCAPLLVEDEVIGVIEFDHHNEPNRFSDEDLTLLDLFASQAATALSNVLLTEQRREAQEKMQEAQARLVATERLRALGQMAAGVAHDFNNLLASILGLSELLLRHENTPAELTPSLERLNQCALDGAGTVTRIQEFAGGAVNESELEPVDLVKLVGKVAGSASPRFEAASGRPATELIQALGPVPIVLGRAADLKDVVLNLVLNGLDAMPEGGTVTLRTLERDGRAVLEVEDTGTGIPPEIRERIFEPFFTTKSGRGHGLGLSICWGMIRRMGGSIDIRPGHRGGTIFVLDMPAAPASEIPDQDIVTKEATAPPDDARILLVEDDPMVREVMGALLDALGHHVSVAADGPEALERLDAAEFDLVITDHGMPGMTGIELAEEIRRRALELPLVLLTGLNPNSLGTDERSPFALVVAKPATVDRLRDAVAEALEKPSP